MKESERKRPKSKAFSRKNTQNSTYLKINLVVAWNKPLKYIVRCTVYMLLSCGFNERFILLLLLLLLWVWLYARISRAHTHNPSQKSTHLSPVTDTTIQRTKKETKTLTTGRRSRQNPMHTELFSYTLLVNRVIGDTVEFYCPEYEF